MAYITFTEYRNMAILYINHRGLSGYELLDNIKLVAQFGNECSEKELLGLFDYRDTSFNGEIIEYLISSENIKSLKNYKKCAVLGINGLRKLLFSICNFFSNGRIKAFDTEIEAKEWLTK